MKNTEKLYNEIKDMANRLEEIRLLLYPNTVHRRLIDDYLDEVDATLFRLQSELRQTSKFLLGE